MAIQIVVGSTNPVKIEAVKGAIVGTCLASATVVGYEVESGVGGQPLSVAQTRRGAINRARRVLQLPLVKQSWLKKGRPVTAANNFPGNSNPVTDQGWLGVGLEGGVYRRTRKELWVTVWAAVATPGGQVFTSNGGQFLVPEVVAQPILAGEEMGQVGARLCGGREVKKQEGLIGLITNKFIDRREEYQSIVKLALGLWAGQDWQRHLESTAANN